MDQRQSFVSYLDPDTGRHRVDVVPATDRVFLVDAELEKRLHEGFDQPLAGFFLGGAHVEGRRRTSGPTDRLAYGLDCSAPLVSSKPLRLYDSKDKVGDAVLGSRLLVQIVSPVSSKMWVLADLVLDRRNFMTSSREVIPASAAATLAPSSLEIDGCQVSDNGRLYRAGKLTDSRAYPPMSIERALVMLDAESSQKCLLVEAAGGAWIKTSPYGWEDHV